MDDDILSQLEELLSMATTEEELQTVMDLYDEYNHQGGEEIDSLLDQAETEDEIQAVMDLYEEGETDREEDEEDDEEPEEPDYGPVEIHVRDAEPESYFYSEGEKEDEEEPEPQPEESTWEKEWLDRDGESHPIYRGEPTEPGAEKRQEFAFLEDAMEYIGEIGAGAGYFDVYDNDGIFEVWFTG